MRATIVVAGSTGDLGRRIVEALIVRGATVRALVRSTTDREKVRRLEALGVAIVGVDYDDAAALANALVGASCVVSALSGFRDVIVDAQSMLLDAAVTAGVPRFIPSDFALDFTKTAPGSNRNLDLRREFMARVDAAPIAATSILNGMFSDLLTGQAPVILFGPRRVLFWGDADRALDFTTMDDTAAFTAAVALDGDTPRILRISGDVRSARGLAQSATAATGKRFGLLRPGGLGLFRGLIGLVRRIAPQPTELYPPWQGMQYLENMLSGRGKLEPLDNDRYPEIRWTSVREMLESHGSTNP